MWRFKSTLIAALCIAGFGTVSSLDASPDDFVKIGQQPSASEPIFSLPLRNLTWGQLNIIHTTDTHGWLPGHLLEPNFSSDWGDLYTFVTRMKEIGKSKGVDVLFIDSGDRHDGNGLSDATYPGGILTERLFLYQDYDLITIGNHELYKYESALTDYEILGKHFGDRYVVSNADLFVNGTWVPMGKRYRRWSTEVQKLNIVGFGFLFNFFGNNPQSRVTLVQDAVEQDWFKEALSYDDTDIFVISAHIPIRFFPEMKIITNAIRKVHPNAAIQFLGGHSHIRDYVVIDKKATALESGRFLETVGWASVDNLDRENGNEDISFSRSYIDANLHSYSYHSGTKLTEIDSSDEEEFFTETGVKISDKIRKLRKNLDLDAKFGCIPQDYLLSRARYPGPDSFFTLIEEKVLPRLVGSNVTLGRSLAYPRYILINTGSIRFDLFKGPYTLDSGFIVSPFVNNWMYLPDVPLKYARKILPELNRLPYIFAADTDISTLGLTTEQLEQGRIVTPGLPPMSYLDMNLPESRVLSYRMFNHYEDKEKQEQEQVLMAAGNVIPKRINKGYVTYDDLGNDGDDTVHDPWTFFPTPNAIQASQNIPSEDGDNPIDVVFYDFLEPFLLDVLRKIEYHNDTILPYGGLNTVEMLTDHVLEVWRDCE